MSAERRPVNLYHPAVRGGDLDIPVRIVERTPRGVTIKLLGPLILSNGVWPRGHELTVPANEVEEDV